MDRTAIHEVMEQGRVAISKAGIHAKLNARCSVLAAANPVYGRYNSYKSPMENIGLQDSLLSRFDLLFVLVDTVDVEKDRKIADHVLRMHRYRNPNEQEGQVLSISSEADVLTTKDLESNEGKDEEETQVYEKYDALLHGNSRSKTDKIVSAEFMKKYIQIAKYMRPVLTDEASTMIAEEYADLRSADFDSEMARTQPVTARALETLIRLATAHAKARLSKTVEPEDANLAIQLVQFAYFKKVLAKTVKRKKISEDGATDEEGEEDEPEEVEIRPTPRKKARKGSAELDSTESDMLSAASEQTQPPHKPVQVTEQRYKHFMKLLYELIQEKYQTQTLEMENVIAFMKKRETESPFSLDEINTILARMEDENKVMKSGETLYIL